MEAVGSFKLLAQTFIPSQEKHPKHITWRIICKKTWKTTFTRLITKFIIYYYLWIHGHTLWLPKGMQHTGWYHCARHNTTCHISSSILSYHMNRKFTALCMGVRIGNYTLFISYLLLLHPRQVQVHDHQSQRSLEWKTKNKTSRSHSHTMKTQVSWDVITCCWVCSCPSVAGSWCCTSNTKYTPIDTAHVPEHVNLHETGSYRNGFRLIFSTDVCQFPAYLSFYKTYPLSEHAANNPSNCSKSSLNVWVTIMKITIHSTAFH